MTLEITGSELIKSKLIDAPERSGVYRMFDVNKQVLYVGKAKNLKKRLTNYIKSNLDNKTLRMIANTCFLEYSITNSEVEALLLEAQLIKKFQPKFNILLKDCKSFPFIKLRLEHDFPQLLKYRGKTLSDGKFFGPFASSVDVNTTLTELQKIFKLRSCTDNYFNSRTRPCLQYEIKRCYAPCVGKINKEDYRDLVTQVKDFLQGRTKELQENLSRKMEELSSQMRFEEAAEIRDRIKALSYVQLKAGVSDVVKDADIIAIVEKNGHYCVEVFLYRAGQACGNIPYFPTSTENSTKEEVLEYFLLQFYQKQHVPAAIIINHEINDKENVIEAIKKINNILQLNITVPNKGGKAKLVQNAEINALFSLEQYLKKFAKNQEIIFEIKELFGLSAIPERIEIYDNSHIQGKFAVGVMVVAGKVGFDKKEYRVFNVYAPSLVCHSRESGDPKRLMDSCFRGNGIKNCWGDIKGDDYEMLRQVLTRRLTRLRQEPHKLPSLMIIDGGKGHLGVVKEVMDKFEMNIPFVCMSKGVDRNAGFEQFHVIGKEVFTLDKNLPVMKYLQILRDEAHNFAIKNHRLGRSRAIKISRLDDIEGVGETRKKALLHYFGSYKAVCDATIYELAKVNGINKLLAEMIFNVLHRKN
ncbi:excinuclease ABC subunit UvrC [Rickettsia rickettsii]|uniref:UvrABC system protein C n=2 Tax=Rickettsia rickettsii TaxID=783 RepID=UVRC_RICRO|nr:excinuclease ABC subunit UvrC [Rickettsia rickettsii]A8GST1.1 RecName: Full=UvrABC system protein C; Short=Protein UvrC; AltName: Full=Excinuclease ABC subunit C [Rickettsia rickettsii str. 'Sheila Smith']B0BYA6.1 RecName: Full=UvrABC system protein C; Short=Protein UvrC; AltName: Full=Excinuclease ABC subunit C [Rickettsia rickettsii str. Iowa]ABV76456.1 excinuclease ABC subunit C [Rickettsia rickettsii str. 'Sheila Smith']ABY72832.1 excinuclease ABC subunit C [Rickettsia rickettsii str. Io